MTFGYCRFPYDSGVSPRRKTGTQDTNKRSQCQRKFTRFLEEFHFKFVRDRRVFSDTGSNP